MADPVLAALLQGESDPIEKLASDQRSVHAGWLTILTEHSARFLKTGQRIALLECGHYTLTRARYRAACPRCGAMIRSGYDHDGFRRLGEPDRFSWPQDPLAALNEAAQADEFVAHRSTGAQGPP